MAWILNWLLLILIVPSIFLKSLFNVPLFVFYSSHPSYLQIHYCVISCRQNPEFSLFRIYDLPALLKGVVFSLISLSIYISQRLKTKKIDVIFERSYSSYTCIRAPSFNRVIHFDRSQSSTIQSHNSQRVIFGSKTRREGHSKKEHLKSHRLIFRTIKRKGSAQFLQVIQNGKYFQRLIVALLRLFFDFTYQWGSSQNTK